ncbi:MAG TPA: 50S ribosomal protein L4 [Candidatus Cloacimonadota bacterium]|mgnify:FL=1|jgi:large subunit ribosomal protein L4|nr:50S ribosomal protein L4 [Candidatus Cloacimonadales bacterium]HPY96902.1 50S ribosomal protein L4 [Candidatus Cloacimonadota bacterium]HQB41866.1 50S ribosomal protein L4 [Candidatus Cloacimonadota bacterium]
MIEAIKYSANGEQIGTVKLPESLFAVTCNNPKSLLYEVVKTYLQNQRQGTVAKRGRGEVRGSTRKIFKQKGSGNARMGNNRTPVRRGGGMAFAIKPKDWYSVIPSKKKRLALKLALTEKANDKQVIIIESLSFDKPSTKSAVELLGKIAPETGKKLMVINGSDINIIKSFSNIPQIRMDRADGLYAYEVLNCKYLIMTEEALNKAVEVFE